MNRRLATVASVSVVVLALGLSAASTSGQTASGRSSRPVCAARLALRPENLNPRSAGVLVPKAPREVLLCRYYGSHEGPDAPEREFGTLAAGRLVRRAAPTRSLARAFDELEPLPDRPLHCRKDNGAALYALFRYANQRQVPVKVGLSGCGIVSNGRLDQAFLLSNDLARRLDGLTAAVQSEA